LPASRPLHAAAARNASAHLQAQRPVNRIRAHRLSEADIPAEAFVRPAGNSLETKGDGMKGRRTMLSYIGSKQQAYLSGLPNPITLAAVPGVEPSTYQTVPFVMDEDGRGAHMRERIKQRASSERVVA
jgi:hypothetical protein